MLGGVTDMLIRKTIYAAPMTRPRVNIVPLVARDRKGLAISIGF